MAGERKTPHEDQLSAVLVACLDALDQGQVVDCDELLRRYPQFARELTKFFTDQAKVDRLAAPLRSAVRHALHATPRPGDTPLPADMTGAGAGDPVDGSFCDYEVLEALGEGGMGVVHKARQKSLQRLVALKRIRLSSLGSETEVQRFRREAEMVALLDHPNILPVYEVGEHGGQPYFSMKWIDGGSLAERVASIQESEINKEACRWAGRIVATVARAVHHAHQRGVLHRDLKPSNILLDAEGRPYVTDFGLAKRVEADSSLTESGVLVGTPSYMAPEQASGRKGAITTATDVYGLGACLYALLAGRPPFRGETVLDTLAQVKERNPEPPSACNRWVERELETICLKAMEKNPDDRYASAQELAEDLEHWLAGEPIKARRANAWQRAAKWVWRRPAVAGFLAASSVAVLALLALGLGLWFNTRLQTALDDAKRFQYFQHIALAGTAWEKNNMGRLAHLLDECPPDYRHYWEWRYLKRQCQADLLTLKGHSAGVRSAMFSPDGKWLATAGADETVKLWDTATGVEEQTLHGHRNEVMGVALSPDGTRLASGGMDGTVRLWHAVSGREERNLEAHANWVVSVAFSPDGTLLASASFDQTIKVWDVDSGRQVVRPLKGHTAGVYSVAFSPDGKRLASGSMDRTVRVWDVATGRELFLLKGHTDWVRGVAFSPDGSRLASASEDRTVKVWDAVTGRELFPLKGHDGGVYSVAFSPDGKRLASGGFDQSVKVWDTATGQEALSLRGHAHVVFGVAFSPDGTRLASASQDRTVKF